MADTTEKTTGDSTQDYVLAEGKNGATDEPGTVFHGTTVPPQNDQKLGHKCKLNTVTIQ